MSNTTKGATFGYDDLQLALYGLGHELKADGHPLVGEYVHSVEAACARLGKVARLDLFNVLQALEYGTDDWAEQHYDTSRGMRVLATAYNEMDMAAAFGTTDVPLVVLAPSANAWIPQDCYSVLGTDDEATARVKRNAQQPATATWFEFTD